VNTNNIAVNHALVATTKLTGAHCQLGEKLQRQFGLWALGPFPLASGNRQKTGSDVPSAKQSQCQLGVSGGPGLRLWDDWRETIRYPAVSMRVREEFLEHPEQALSVV
jgi:hypothetical protein